MAVYRFPENYVVSDFSDYQSLYMDQQTGELIPATEVWLGSELSVHINALGCKGPEIDLQRPVLGCFGCSTTFGIGGGYPGLLRFQDCQVLNAAGEGYSMDRVVKRWRQLKESVSFTGIIAYLGWHNLLYNRRDEAYWQTIFDQLDGPHLTALCTISTCLIPECLEKGFEPLLNLAPGQDGYRGNFTFWSYYQPTREIMAALLEAIDRYNGFARAYAKRKNWVLLDLHEALLPRSYQAIPQDFFDICHWRPEAYPRVAAYIQSVLEGPLAQRLSANAPVSSQPQPAQEAAKAAWREQIYPIW